jgi:hypothetical protein
MSAEDLQAAQDQRNQDNQAEVKRGSLQLKITQLAWGKLPLPVRKRVLADPLLTLAEAKSGSAVQPQPAPPQPAPHVDFDFTQDDD